MPRYLIIPNSEPRDYRGVIGICLILFCVIVAVVYQYWDGIVGKF